MITPTEIKEKARRLYPMMVRAWLDGDASFFPRRIPSNLKLPADLAAAKRLVDRLRAAAKGENDFGYTIEWEERRSRSHGLNRFPTSISIETEFDFLRLIGKQSEFSMLQNAVSLLLDRQPTLRSWLTEKNHWKDILPVADQLKDLLLVTEYLLAHPRPDCFVREIPLPISTKLIEENRKLLSDWLDRLLPSHQIDYRFSPNDFEARYGLRYARQHLLFRCLNNQMRDELQLPFEELSLPAQAVGSLAVESDVRVFVVENKINLLTFPPTSRAVALGGLGKAVSLLRDVHWLATANVYYWGDLDVEGFEILNQFRESFPQVKSHLMDLATLEKHRHWAIPGNKRSPVELLHLSEEESRTFDYLLENGLRLEQERIPQSEVLASINSLGGRPHEAE